MSSFQLLTETVAGLELRPWTLSTQKAIGFLSEKQLAKADQTVAMVYIQSQSPKSIREAIQKGTLLNQIDDFIDDFPLYSIAPVSDWCKRQLEKIDANRVEVLPRGEPDPNTPPNL